MPPPDSRAEQLARLIGGEFRRRLLGEYVPRIRRCLELLTDEQVWRRPGEHGNSVANLLMHLAGNVRQWILCGLGGAEDRRDRDLEFRAASGDVDMSAAELIDRLEATVAEATSIVDGLVADDLLAEQVFQGRYSETGAAAVLHVMEHFSGHAGQIYAYTKQVAGVDLKFYDL